MALLLHRGDPARQVLVHLPQDCPPYLLQCFSQLLLFPLELLHPLVGSLALFHLAALLVVLFGPLRGQLLQLGLRGAQLLLLDL